MSMMGMASSSVLLWLASSMILLLSGVPQFTNGCIQGDESVAMVAICAHGPCLPCCSGLQCPTNERCCSGFCKQVECCVHDDCPPVSACFNGQCKMLPSHPTGCGFGRVCCSVDEDCYQGLKCSADGICERGFNWEWPCGNDVDCGDASQRCCNGRCKKAQCCVDKDCGGGGRCVNGACKAWVPACPIGQKRCTGGHCSRCCSDMDCGDGKNCVRGKCRWACSFGQERCKSGRCRPCCEGSDCEYSGRQ